jgi:hypothetical protein
MGIGQVLDQIREYYVHRFMLAAERNAATKGSRIVLEPALRDAAGNPAVSGPLGLGLRRDMAFLRNGAVAAFTTVDTEGMLSFDPVEFDWGALRVSMGPFRWQQVSLRMPRPQPTDWQPLKDWFWRWFRPELDGDDHTLLGAVHFLSDPEVSDNAVVFSADLGSAPVEAFEELLDAIVALRVSRCQIGQAD